MGFEVYYRSTRPVSVQARVAIRLTANELCRGRTWLSCEPVCFFTDDGGGHIAGGCKPNFMPHPDDVAAANAEGLPDGTISDAFDVLCQLSRKHKVDWEVSHDESGGPIGFIRGGVADPDLLNQIEAIGSLRDVLAEFQLGDQSDQPSGDSDDDSGPTILPFRPIGN